MRIGLLGQIKLRLEFCQVPLDYAHPEVGNATLALARIKASKQPRLGTLFTNPGEYIQGSWPDMGLIVYIGGPGGSGVNLLVEEIYGELISNISNNQYDIVGESLSAQPSTLNHALILHPRLGPPWRRSVYVSHPKNT
jgi:hypothetical protein